MADLKQVVKELAGAQQRTEEHVGKLDEHMAQLDGHMARLDEHMARLEVAMTALAEAQQASTVRLDNLQAAVGSLANTFGFTLEREG